MGPTPGVTTRVVVVGPTTDGDVGTADGALPYDDDFDPITTEGDRDEVTAAVFDGVDFDSTSLDLASTRGGDATATMPVDTGRGVDGISEGAEAANESDPVPDWEGGDEVTSTTTTSSVTATRRRTRRSKHSHVVRDERKRVDFDSTSLDLASTRGSNATASMPVDTGRGVDGMSEGAAAANDSDSISDWEGGDEVTSTTTTSSVTATRKRTRRGKHSHVVRDERKRQRKAASLSTTQSDTEAGT